MISLTYKIKGKVLLIHIFIHILGSLPPTHTFPAPLCEAGDHLRFHKLAYTDQTERFAKGIGRHLLLLLLWLQVSNSSLEVGLMILQPQDVEI